VFKRSVTTKIKQISQKFEVQKLSMYASSFGWLLLERGVSIVLGMVIAVALARYLGPEDFGQYNYAISFVALFGFLSYLGLDGIVTRDLVHRPDLNKSILGTVFVLRLGGSIIGAFLVVGIITLLNDEIENRSLVILISTSLLFNAFAAIDFWFQSKVENKYTAIARTIAVVIGSVIYFILIAANAAVAAFAVAFVLLQGFKAIALIIAYYAHGNRITSWRYDNKLARSLLSKSWPLIIASAGSLIYLKVDQIMLGNMAGAAEVGTYSAAVKLSEVWYVLPTLVAISIFPAIVRSKALTSQQYQGRLQKAYTTLAWSGITVAIIMFLMSNFLIDFLYGEAYQDASTILMVHIWACPFMFMGPILSKWLIVEDLLIFSLIRHGLGAIINILLNILLIPVFGGVGAAIATVISYSVAVYFFCFINSKTRIAGKMMTKAFLAPCILGYNRMISFRNI